MSVADDPIPQFECDSCHRLFHWTHKLAGKVVRCPCGQVLTCPEHPPVGAEPILEAIAVAPEPEPEAAAAPVQKVAVRRVRSPDAPKPLVEPGMIRDLYMPLCLLGGGVILELLITAIEHGSAFFPALLNLGQDLGGRAALILVGMFAAARIRHFSLGRFWPAVLKVLSIAIAVPAVMDIFWPVLSQMFCGIGALIGVIASLFGYFVLIGTLFDLEESDTFDCIGVIFFVYVGIFIVHRVLAAKA